MWRVSVPICTISPSSANCCLRRSSFFWRQLHVWLFQLHSPHFLEWQLLIFKEIPWLFKFLIEWRQVKFYRRHIESRKVGSILRENLWIGHKWASGLFWSNNRKRRALSWQHRHLNHLCRATLELQLGCFYYRHFGAAGWRAEGNPLLLELCGR